MDVHVWLRVYASISVCISDFTCNSTTTVFDNKFLAEKHHPIMTCLGNYDLVASATLYSLG